MTPLLKWIREGFSRHLAFSTAIVLVFSGLMVTLLLYKPLFGAWRERVGQVEAQKIKLARHQNLVGRKESLVSELERYEGKFLRRYTHDEEVAVLSKQLDAFSSQAGLKINEIRPVGGQEKDGLDVIAIELTVEGDLTQFAQFLYAVASTEDLLEVRNLSLLRRRTGDGKLAITAEITKVLFAG